jgi:hypothetical protein
MGVGVQQNHTHTVTHVIVVVVVVVVILVVVVVGNLHTRDAISVNDRGFTERKRLAVIEILVNARFSRNGAALVEKDSKVNRLAVRRAIWSNIVLAVVVRIILEFRCKG